MKVCDFRTVISTGESWGSRAAARVCSGLTGLSRGTKQTDLPWLTCHSARTFTALERLQEELSTEGQYRGTCPAVHKGT